MNTLVPDGDRFIAVRLSGDNRGAELPVGQLPLETIELVLNDGRSIVARHEGGALVVRVTDLDSGVLAELPVPSQKAELIAKANRLRAVSERLAARLAEVASEAEQALNEAQQDSAATLPPIALPGPRRDN